MKILSFFILLAVLLYPSAAQPGVALSKDPAIVFKPGDRVLIMAPHPDDETIATGGVVQQALKAGARVKVCLLTNGENNEFAFIVYERRIVLKPKEFLRLGELRRQETLEAMKLLGVPSGDVVSLGYPDYGTMEIFLKYWGEVKPFRSMLSRVRKVPYASALSPDAPYVGESILKDVRQVMADFKPTKIFVSHPADVNRDHRAAYLFTQVALWDLQVQGLLKDVEVIPFIVHVPGWPVPRGYHPELPLEIPSPLEKTGIKWIEQMLDPAEIGKKYDATLKFPSQIRYAPRYIVTFVRRNELFGNYPVIRLERQLASDTELKFSAAGVNDPLPGRLKSTETNHFSGLSYARQGNDLIIRVAFKRLMDKEFGLSLFLMGYSDKVPFAQMPKISLIVGLDGFYIKDRKRTIHDKDVFFSSKDKEMVFRVPLSILGDPDRILSCAKTVLYDLTLDETAWRILEVK